MKWLKIWWYNFVYDLDIETGYIYKRMKYSTIPQATALNCILISDGWERISDIEGYGAYMYVWYKKQLGYGK